MKTRLALSAAILALALMPLGTAPVSANMGGMTQSGIAADDLEDSVIQVQRGRGGGGGGNVNRGNVNRGNVNRANVNRSNVNRANVNRTNVNRGNVNRGNVNVNRNVNRNVNVNTVYRGGSWSRPRNYWWPVGGAIAAGAAMGMIAASSAAWAGPPPGPGFCWFYTDPSQRQGFWDTCPW